MKKIITILAAMSLLLGVSACKKTLPDDNGGGQEGETSWIAFSISMPNRLLADDLGSKNAGDTYVGTPDEQAVTGAYIVLYDASGVVKYAVHLDANTNGTTAFSGEGVATVADGATAPTISTFTSKALEVTKGTYQAYLFLNGLMTNNINLPKVGEHIDNLKKAMTDPGLSESLFMSNAKGGVEVKASDFKGTKEDAVGAPVKIAVDRYVAKVFLDGKDVKVLDAMGQPTQHTVVANRFMLNVVNKKMFMVRQMAKAVKELNVFEPETATTARFKSYAKDPNFTHKSKEVKDLLDDYIYVNFNLKPNNTELIPNATIDEVLKVNPDLRRYVGKVGFADENGVYCLENTMDEADNIQTVATQLLIEATYQPHDILRGAGDPEPLSFVIADGLYYRGDEFQKVVDKIIEEYKKDKEQSSAAIASKVTNVTMKLVEWVIEKFKKDDTFKGDQVPVVAVAQGGEEPVAPPSFVDGPVKFYSEGRCYYTAYIRHFDDTQSAKKNGYGRYGVVRNNIYKLTLNSVRGPGEPIIPTPEPTPIDKDKAYVAVSCEVNPWIVRTQLVDID